VVVQAHKDGDISVNDEPIDGARRLHNGDRLTLFPTAVAPEQNRQYLIFHVPASLVALDSMLPQKLPPPVAVRAETETNTKQPDPTSTLPSVPERRAALFDQQIRYFGYFTLIELMLMACGTLIAAVIIFLFLEYL
jgi:hypothetical protein